MPVPEWARDRLGRRMVEPAVLPLAKADEPPAGIQSQMAGAASPAALAPGVG